MSIAEWLGVATGFVALVSSAIAVYLGLRKAPFDESKSKADTTETYSRAADSTASRYLVLLDRLDIAEKKQDELQDIIRNKMDEIAELKRKVKDLEDEITELKQEIAALEAEVLRLKQKYESIK
jgi:predicted  nucleic acid-binding Zn-ribbon protein